MIAGAFVVQTFIAIQQCLTGQLITPTVSLGVNGVLGYGCCHPPAIAPTTTDRDGEFIVKTASL